MRRILVSLTALGILLVATTAQAAVDLEEGVCFDEAAGEMGRWNGTAANDAGCITENEYSVLYSPQGLTEAGVLDEVVDNGDGTVTGTLTATGVSITVEADPLDREVSGTVADPAPQTVRVVLFGFFQPQ